MRYLPLAAVAAMIAMPVRAQDEERSASEDPPVTVSGSATIASDYRFRGVSQTDEGFAIQGGVTATHESGIYVGAWGSNLAGWGTFGGANMELDLVAGLKVPVGAGMLDTGLTWYMYPGGAESIAGSRLVASLTASF